MKQTGELIQQLRIEAGYTQKSLAAALHITDKAISKWERGICLPDVSLLPKLSLLLDADVELLVSNSIAEENWLGLIEIQQAVFVFCPEADMDAYFSDKKEFVKKASVRTLGRGMVCLDMDDCDKIVDVSYFVRTYQKNAGLLIGSIEEIAYNMDFIDEKQLTDLADNVSYGNVLKQVAKKGKFHK